jgi:hypothetical protein
MLYDKKKYDSKEIVEKYFDSDEKLEVICLKFLMKDDYESLNMYINKYIKEKNQRKYHRGWERK